MRYDHLFKLLAVPAIGGLLFAAGCDRDDAADTTPTPTTPTDRDTTGTTPPTDADTAGARMEGEVSDQQVEQVTQRIQQMRDRVRDAAEGADAATAETHNLFAQRLDSLNNAVENREWPRVTTLVTEMRANLPEQYREDFNQLLSELQRLNVPALQGLGAGQGEDIEMPTAPGVPPPGDTGGTTPPGGAGGGGF